MRFSIIIIASLALIGLFISILPTPEVAPKPEATGDESRLTIPDNGNYHLTNVTVFDGQQWHEHASLAVQNGRIVSPASLSDATIVDGQGGFVIPGLIDAHTHSWGKALRQSLQFGVTTTLDMFSDSRFFLAKKAQRSGLTATEEADLFSSGILVTSVGGHGTEYGISIPTIGSSDQAHDFVAARLAEGSDYIKIVYDAAASQAGHKGRFTSIDYDTLAAVVRAAHAQEALAVVHVMDLTSAEHAARAGADGLVHTFGGTPVSDELIALMKSQDMFVIPTLSILASLAGEGRGQALIEDSVFSTHLAADVKHTIANDIASDRVAEDYFAIAIENTRRMHVAGIAVLAGTDAPNQGTAHGVSLHDELALLVDSGLSPTDALTAATYLPYATFAIGERGHLRHGARADFIVLNNDPREDIKHTQHIRWIVKNGYQATAYFASQKVTGETPSSGLVSRFTHDLTSQLGGQFVVSTDQMMQGNSTAEITHISQGCDNSGALAVTGTIGKQFPYPWSGVFLMFSESMDGGYNLSNFKRIVFDVAGTDGEFRFMVLTSQTGRPSDVSFVITGQCRQVAINLSDIGGVDWASVTGIGWAAGKATPDFNFTLDNIYFE
ncbi:amidohydrolase family protein [Alteromonas sp. H39]|uniref:amidohydrolase family protein n=1 Tax=Alteromonas sp. H39 TaxID=3389876 RepID=UPI0039E06551